MCFIVCLDKPCDEWIGMTVLFIDIYSKRTTLGHKAAGSINIIIHTYYIFCCLRWGGLSKARHSWLEMFPGGATHTHHYSVFLFFFLSKKSYSQENGRIFFFVSLDVLSVIGCHRRPAQYVSNWIPANKGRAFLLFPRSIGKKAQRNSKWGFFLGAYCCVVQATVQTSGSMCPLPNITKGEIEERSRKKNWMFCACNEIH